MVESAEELRLLRHLRSVGTVLLEDTGWREFTQLMTNHVFRDENRVENFAVVNQKGMPDEVRSNGRTPGPRLDRAFDAGIVDFVDLFEEMLLDERTFFKRSAHKIELLASLAAFDDETIAPLVFATSFEATR